MLVRVVHEPKRNHYPAAETALSAILFERVGRTVTYMTFMNYRYLQSISWFFSAKKHETHNQVHIEVQRVARVQIRGSSQPLRAERHPPTVQLCRAQHNDPVVSSRVLAGELVEDEAAQRAGAEHGEDLERDDGRVGEAPAEVCVRVFFPKRGEGPL